MLRGWGFRSSDVTRAITLTGVWNQLANLVFPVVALSLLKADGGETALLGTAAFVGVVVLGVVVALLTLVLYSDGLGRAVAVTGPGPCHGCSPESGAARSAGTGRALRGFARKRSSCSHAAGTC